MKKIRPYFQSKAAIICFYIFSLTVLFFATLLNGGDWAVLRIYTVVTATIFIIYLFAAFYMVCGKADYEKLYKTLEKEMKEAETESRRREEDINNYFVTWVHQIKTPITASKMILDKWGELTAENRKELKNRILSIDGYTNMALGYLKVLGDAPDLYLNLTSVDSIINPVVKKYSPVFISKFIKLSYEKTEDKVVTDVKWARLMVEQIIGNSLKYTDRGHISIEYDSDRMCLSIKDDGIGIENSDLPNIFHLGYSGKNGSINDQSTGIGLFLVDKISHRLNVKVKVLSEVGIGTIVELFFPKQY